MFDALGGMFILREWYHRMDSHNLGKATGLHLWTHSVLKL
jgi:hypothetical protein